MTAPTPTPKKRRQSEEEEVVVINLNDGEETDKKTSSQKKKKTPYIDQYFENYLKEGQKSSKVETLAIDVVSAKCAIFLWQIIAQHEPKLYAEALHNDRSSSMPNEPEPESQSKYHQNRNPSQKKRY